MKQLRISARCVALTFAATFLTSLPGQTRTQAKTQAQNAAQRQQAMSVEQITKRVPAGVKYVADLAYREGNPAWRADLAMPTASGKPRPGVVVVHGGGWTGGDKRQGMFAEIPLELAQKGYVAISINYRFVTEAPMPACIEDVKTAVRWFRAHAKEFNVDPNRIGGFGYSAGAHLVAMLALAGPDAGLEGDGPYKDQPSNLQAACAGGTPADLLNWDGRSPGDASRLAAKFGGPESTLNERAKRFSPVTYVSRSAPPMLLLHGNADTTVPLIQGEGLVKALRGAGAKNVNLIIFDAANHGMFNTHSAVARAALYGFLDSTIGAGLK